MEAYWYLVGFLGCMVNFLLALGANLLSGHPPDWKRLAFAGLIGGLHAAGCIFARFSFLSDIHWRLLSIVLMAVTAFGWNASGLPCCALFLMLRLALDELSSGGLWPMLLFGALVILLCGFGNRGKGNYVTISMEHSGKHVELMALVDTGNSLVDPVSGKEVIVVGCDVASQLLGLKQEALASPLETMCHATLTGLRLIPYSAIGVPAGFLLGLRLDLLKIDGKESDLIVAFAPQKIGQGKQFQALAGGNI